MFILFLLVTGLSFYSLEDQRTPVPLAREHRRDSRLECRQRGAVITTAAFVARDFVLMKSSTKDKIKGGFREAKGEAKKKAGKATGNPDLRDRGTMEKAGGKMQRKIGDVKKVFEQ